MRDLAAGVSLVLLMLVAGCASPSTETLDAGVVTPDEPVPPDAPEWAPLASASIRPGTPIVTSEGECTSNFVFSRANGTQAFVGTTAACVRELTIGSVATIGGPRNLAILVYSSWITMGDVGETDPAAHEYNDFAVFYVDASTRHTVNPALPQTGGPTGLRDAGAVGLGERLRYWGRTPQLSENGGWHDAVVTGKVGDWAVLAHGVLPAAPGTMGGGVVTTDGEAVGVMVNLGVSPNPGANGVARLDTLMAYAEQHARLDMELATWDLLG